MKKIYVLSFIYFDGSGYKVVATYTENQKQEAEKTFKICVEFNSGDRLWELKEMPVNE